jgi:hypothetical protein
MAACAEEVPAGGRAGVCAVHTAWMYTRCERGRLPPSLSPRPRAHGPPVGRTPLLSQWYHRDGRPSTCERTTQIAQPSYMKCARGQPAFLLTRPLHNTKSFRGVPAVCLRLVSASRCPVAGTFRRARTGRGIHLGTTFLAAHANCASCCKILPQVHGQLHSRSPTYVDAAANSLSPAKSEFSCVDCSARKLLRTRAFATTLPALEAGSLAFPPERRLPGGGERRRAWCTDYDDAGRRTEGYELGGLEVHPDLKEGVPRPVSKRHRPRCGRQQPLSASTRDWPIEHKPSGSRRSSQEALTSGRGSTRMAHTAYPHALTSSAPHRSVDSADSGASATARARRLAAASAAAVDAASAPGAGAATGTAVGRVSGSASASDSPHALSLLSPRCHTGSRRGVACAGSSLRDGGGRCQTRTLRELHSRRAPGCSRCLPPQFSRKSRLLGGQVESAARESEPMT